MYHPCYIRICKDSTMPSKRLNRFPGFSPMRLKKTHRFFHSPKPVVRINRARARAGAGGFLAVLRLRQPKNTSPNDSLRRLQDSSGKRGALVLQPPAQGVEHASAGEYPYLKPAYDIYRLLAKQI